MLSSSEASSSPPRQTVNRQTVNVTMGGVPIVTRILVSNDRELRYSDEEMANETDPDRTSSDSNSPTPVAWAKLISLYPQNSHEFLRTPVFTVGSQHCHLCVQDYTRPVVLCQLKQQGGPLLALLEILVEWRLIKVNGETKSKNSFVYLRPGDEIVFGYPSEKAYVFHPDPYNNSSWNSIWNGYSHGTNPIQEEAKEYLKKNLRRRVLNPQDIEVSFENFPYFLSATTREALIASPYVHMKCRREFAKLSIMCPRILLTGPEGSEIYQEMLGKALAKEFNSKLMIIDSLVLPWEYFDTDSLASERREKIFQAGDRVIFCGPSTSSPTPTQNLRGPGIGFQGRVLLPFEGNGYSYIGVRFDESIPDGNDLDHLCEESHGFFCAASSLKLDDSFYNDANAIAIDEIFEVAFSESNGEPFVLFLKNVKSCLAFSDVYGRLKVKLKNLPEKFIVIASQVGIANEDAEMSTLFPTEVIILLPKDEALLLNWKEKLVKNSIQF